MELVGQADHMEKLPEGERMGHADIRYRICGVVYVVLLGHDPGQA